MKTKKKHGWKRLQSGEYQHSTGYYITKLDDGPAPWAVYKPNAWRSYCRERTLARAKSTANIGIMMDVATGRIS